MLAGCAKGFLCRPITAGCGLQRRCCLKLLQNNFVTEAPLKPHLGIAIKEFTFSKDHCYELLQVLPRRSKKDQDAAKSFVNASRRKVELWLSQIQIFNTKPKCRKSKLERIRLASITLRAALDDLPAASAGSLYAEIIATLHCDPFKQRHNDFIGKLKRLGITNPLKDDFLEELLDVVIDSAERLTSMSNVHRGVDNSQMIGLTANLADLYSKHFQKQPTAGNGSNFRKFMGGLSVILGYDFGAKTVQDALKMRKQIRNEFAHVIAS